MLTLILVYRGSLLPISVLVAFLSGVCVTSVGVCDVYLCRLAIRAKTDLHYTGIFLIATNVSLALLVIVHAAPLFPRH